MDIYEYDQKDGDFVEGGMGVIPVAYLAWSMFSQSGFPGFYMLYNDLKRGDDRSIFD